MSKVLDVIDTTYVWDIGDLDPTDGRRFGGKATGLARMAAAGIPVPPAFVVSTDAFRAFAANDRRLPDGLSRQMDRAIGLLGEKLGKRFGGGGGQSPLLVSVRSGAQISMPGMMDTVLNLGLDATSAKWMIEQGSDRGFVIDTWLRFWKMYAEIVLGLDGEEFSEGLAAKRSAAERGDLELALLEQAVIAWLGEQGVQTTTVPAEQLQQAVSAVFSSWDSPRAKAYREHQGIPHDLGTAVTVQAMVFGNADAESGSGVAFSRNPNTGEPALYGEYLVGRQGEDIVSGARTPVDLSRGEQGYENLRRKLAEYSQILEKLYGDAVDMEFTVEAGTLYLLQVRSAKRTAEAAVRIAVDLIKSGNVAPSVALSRVSIDQLRRMLRPVFNADQLAAATPIAKGIGSSPGQVSGVAVLDSDRAAERAAGGESVVLVRPTTSPLDIRGMLAAAGVLTARGGALSHAAVVSRALDKPCVVGCEALTIDSNARSFSVGDRTWNEGHPIAIDGASGQIYAEVIPLVPPEQGGASLDQLLDVADTLSRSEIWLTPSGIDTPLVGNVPGLAVVGLTDVAIASGQAEGLIENVRKLARGGDRDVERNLSAAAARLGELALRSCQGRPLHLRLPAPASSRARVLMPDWEEFDPHLFLPLGNRAYIRAWLEGLAEASKAANAPVTILLGGVTDANEWTQFEQEVARFAPLQAGLAVQSVACLEQAPAMLAAGALLWLDMPEILHSAYGFVSVQNVSGAILDDYVKQGSLSTRPDVALRPFMRDLVAKVVHADPGQRVGGTFDSHVTAELVSDMYAIGLRRFSVPAEQRDIIRLVLGQQVEAL